jgi:DNA-binding FadR family transcriptional regulator
LPVSKDEASPVRPAYAALADVLRGRILDGELPAGSRLPSESELSAEFGVGRSTVREALSALASQNLILTTRGVTGGSFVVIPTVDSMSAHLETGVGLMAAAQDVSVVQLMEARQMLEVPAAGMAAHRIDESGLEELRGTIFDPAGTPGPSTYAKNQEFHLVLLRATNNPLLEVITAPVFRVMASRFGRDRAPSDFWTRVDADHREILGIVETGDSLGAMAAMRRHLDHLGDVYTRIDRRDGR